MTRTNWKMARNIHTSMAVRQIETVKSTAELFCMGTQGHSCRQRKHLHTDPSEERERERGREQSNTTTENQSQAYNKQQKETADDEWWSDANLGGRMRRWSKHGVSNCCSVIVHRTSNGTAVFRHSISNLMAMIVQGVSNDFSIVISSLGKSILVVHCSLFS